MDNKIVLLDWNGIMVPSIMAWRVSQNKSIPPTYIFLASIIACLGRVAVAPDDIVIFAIDSKLGSWRRDIDFSYKANRRELREAQTDLDWSKLFAMFNELKNRLDYGTSFHFIDIDKLEADDIIAYATKYYSDNLCVIISSDADMEQLVARGNVRIFSPKSKEYKIVTNPFSILAKKIQKETVDNLITPILDQKDYENRKMIVDLIDLPPHIESSIKEKLDTLGIKDVDIEYFNEVIKSPQLQERFANIYNSKNVVNYEKSINRKPKKKGKKYGKRASKVNS